MSEYNKYVLAVNKIFEIVSKMKVSWPDQDNINYLESIEEYKQIVAENVKLFSQTVDNNDDVMEELGNDWKLNIWRSFSYIQRVKK